MNLFLQVSFCSFPSPPSHPSSLPPLPLLFSFSLLIQLLILYFKALERDGVSPNVNILHTMLMLRSKNDNLRGCLPLYKSTPHSLLHIFCFRFPSFFLHLLPLLYFLIPSDISDAGLVKFGGDPPAEVFHEVLRMCCQKNDLPNVSRVISDMQKLRATSVNQMAVYNYALALAAKSCDHKKCAEFLLRMKLDSLSINSNVLQVLK